MSKIKTLPKKIVVKIEKTSDGDWLLAALDISGMADMGQSVRVGTYQLVEEHMVEGVPRVTPVGKAKKKK